MIRENRQFEDVCLNSRNNLLITYEHKEIFTDVTVECTDRRLQVAACDNELNNSKLERLHEIRT